jgi:hypothetical protein
MIRLAACMAAIIAMAASAATTPNTNPEVRDTNSQPALTRPVTLFVPDSRPITLVQALQTIGRQTGALLRVDADVATDVRFSGRFTRTPLSIVLDSLAKTGAFKWYAETDGAVQIAPHDDLRLMLNAQAISGEACTHCRRPLEASWRFCPWCGRAVGASKRSGTSPAGK